MVHFFVYVLQVCIAPCRYTRCDIWTHTTLLAPIDTDIESCRRFELFNKNGRREYLNNQERDFYWPLTWGMMVSLFLSTCSPRSAMWTPSMVIRPSAPSMIRNNASVNDDLPAPVRPTTPIYNAQRVLPSNVWHLHFLHKVCQVLFLLFICRWENTIIKKSQINSCFVHFSKAHVAFSLPFDIVLFTIWRFPISAPEVDVLNDSTRFN